MKITEKVSFNIESEASYVYILSGQKLIKTRLKRLSAYKRDQFTDKNDIKFMIEKHYKSETKT